MTYRITTWL